MEIKKFNENQESKQDKEFVWLLPKEGWDQFLNTKKHNFNPGEYVPGMIVYKKIDSDPGIREADGVYIIGSNWMYDIDNFDIKQEGIK